MLASLAGPICLLCPQADFSCSLVDSLAGPISVSLSLSFGFGFGLAAVPDFSGLLVFQGRFVNSCRVSVLVPVLVYLCARYLY